MENLVKDELNKVIKNVELINLEGFFPDSRAYSIVEVLDDDEIFIHGGSNKKKDYSQIDVFDAVNIRWRSVAEISTVDPFFVFDMALAGHSANLVKTGKSQSSLVIYGGYNGKSYSNSIYIIETENYQFTQVDVRANKTNEYPQARCYHTSNYDSNTNSLLVFGGWNGNINSLHNQNFLSLWKFDLISKK